ncbi:MAG TPA: GNAT family N-acetyltransferase [Methylomirabilota bacterium]|nr:GNAT family N-acetyltransferase [Methylomirabilota bacterium]
MAPPSAPPAEHPARSAASARASYRVRFVSRAADLPATPWMDVRGLVPTVFMDPRFLAAVERAFEGQGGFLHALVVDQRERAMAWASLCTFPVDVLTLAGPRIQTIARDARSLWPMLGCLRTLFVGLPVSLGQSHLVMAPEADPVAVVAALDSSLDDIAARERAWLVVWKEFDPGGAARLAPLLDRGYRRAESPAMHELDVRFKDFADYCAALKSHYRNDVRRSERKFRAARLEVAQLSDAEAIRRLYTPEVHRLYEAVVARSSVKLEVLPIEFFHELTRQLPGLVTVTVITRDDRVVAFNWGLMDGRVHHYLFCGIDYAAAGDADLYFNLMYHHLDDALRRGPERIEVGQTADTFKARLGCRATPRYFFVKPRGAAARLALRHGFGVLFPERPPAPTYSVFRSE